MDISYEIWIVLKKIIISYLYYRRLKSFFVKCICSPNFTSFKADDWWLTKESKTLNLQYTYFDHNQGKALQT